MSYLQVNFTMAQIVDPVSQNFFGTKFSGIDVDSLKILANLNFKYN
jgi:hypothetical protein